jgi:hypothetical protein
MGTLGSRVTVMTQALRQLNKQNWPLTACGAFCRLHTC